jgi:hypothetical protein
MIEFWILDWRFWILDCRDFSGDQAGASQARAWELVNQLK